MLARALVVGAGGFLGSAARYLVQGLVYRLLPADFPYGTFFINVSGCFAIGFLGEVAQERFLIGPSARLFLMVGILGGYTTFSTFGYETLELLREGQLLRIFIGEADRWEGRPLYEAIVREARQRGLAGATVFRGFEGFGAHSLVHTTRILRLSEDLPLLIEIVDTEEKVQGFLPRLDEMVKEGLVTVEKATVIFYRAGDRPPEE